MMLFCKFYQICSIFAKTVSLEKKTAPRQISGGLEGQKRRRLFWARRRRRRRDAQPPTKAHWATSPTNKTRSHCNIGQCSFQIKHLQVVSTYCSYHGQIMHVHLFTSRSQTALIMPQLSAIKRLCAPTYIVPGGNK